MFLLVLALAACAGVKAERLPIKTYTTAEGLWSSAVEYLMRDSHGFVWFCTRDGLSRFDGYRFVNYKLGDHPSQAYVSYLFETRKGIYWIVTNGGGLYRFDPRQATGTAGAAATEANSVDGRVRLNAQLISSRSFSTLIEDSSGHLWAGSDELLLIEDRNGQISFHPVELNLPADLKQGFYINAIIAASDGSLWLGTSEGLLRRFPDGRVAQITVRPGPDYIRNLLGDREGRIWFSDDDNLYVLKPEPPIAYSEAGAFVSRPLRPPQPVARSGQTLLPDKFGDALRYDAISGAQVRGLYQASDGRIWIAAPGEGLVVYDGQRFHQFLTSLQSPVGSINGALAEDLDGDLWIGSMSGVLRLTARSLTTYDTADGLNANARIQSIYEDRNRALVVVNDQRLLSWLDNRRFKSVQPNVPRDAASVWTSTVAFLDHAGDWWFLTSKGLYRFAHINRLEDLAQRRRTALYTSRDGLPREIMYCMFEDSRGDLWVSTRGGGSNGLARWQRSTETFHAFTAADGLPSQKSASSFAEDWAGNLWFGFYQGGLARYSAGRFTAFTPEDGLPDGFITRLYLDHARRLWLTSNGGGLSRIDDPTAARPRFLSYTTKDGLSSNNARCITEDLDGRIYVGTVRGVDRFTPQTGRVKHYTVSDGLAAGFVNTAYRDHNGLLWFGTSNGLSRLDPKSDWPEPEPSIAINGLRIAGVQQPLDEFGSSTLAGLELSPAQNNLQIDFSSLSLAHAESLRYQYQLEGADGDWGAPTEQRTVTYARLSPGKYRFLVRAVNAEGVASEAPATVSFTILPPFWRRWWFIALVTLAALSGALTVGRYRAARVRERRQAEEALRRSREERFRELERVRKRIASDLHDDIGASLTQISLLSEVMRRRVDGRDAAVTQPLTMIAASSRELVDAMSDIVWAINPEKDHLSDLSRRMRSLASDVLTAGHVEFRFRAPDSTTDVPLGANLRREVFLIFKESVNNIVKHSGCTSADIEFHSGAGNLFLKVSDNGRGFDGSREGEGHGLVSMRARAREMGGSLEILSVKGQGTTVTLQVPFGVVSQIIR